MPRRLPYVVVPALQVFVGADRPAGQDGGPALWRQPMITIAVVEGRVGYPTAKASGGCEVRLDTSVATTQHSETNHRLDRDCNIALPAPVT